MLSWLEKHSKVSWTITIIIALIIFYVSSLTFTLGPPSPITSIKPILYHIFAFFGLAFFLLITLVKGKHKEFIFPAILIAIIYAITDEIHQLFVPGRFGSISDVITDSIGIIFATMIYAITIQYRKLFLT
jgi:VanZ family protein